MITRIVCMTFHPKHINDFQELFRHTSPQISSFIGCHEVQLLRDLHRPEVFFTISKWHDEEALNNYRESALFKQTWSLVKQWFSAPPSAYSLLPAS